MKRVVLGTMSVAAVTLLFASQVVSQPPGKEPPGKQERGERRGAPRFEVGQIFPPPLMEQLELTSDQLKELESIQRNLKTRIDKLLTDDQRKIVENFRPRGPGGPEGRPDGPGRKGPPDEEKGGPGEKRGERPPPDKRGEKPAGK